MPVGVVTGLGRLAPMPAVPCLQVALPVPVPRLFDYLPPDGKAADAAAIGQRVRVPFGNRELVGVVAGIGVPEAGIELRQATSLPDALPVFSGELLDSLRWLARYTHAPPGDVFATALPAALRAGEALPDTHAWAWVATEAGTTGREGLRKGSRPRRLADLLAHSAVDEDRLERELEGWRTAARALARRGHAERIAVPARTDAPASRTGPPPNPEQQAAIDAIIASEGFAPLLLEGVTGSGKTEVYLHAIARCLAQGRQALVLVPEIGLTPQTLARFRARLGVPVHALHSGLADGERARVWAAAWRGEARVIVGTRSAVFTPLPDAGLIVIDEEHDASYKQQDGIRYHARDFALVRAKALGVPVLLGSATPSLETLHNAQAGRYAHLRLRHRAGEARPPTVRIIDVRKRPLQAGLAPETLQAIEAALRDGGQVLVFKNRRGYAPVLLCHDCGWSAHCPRCSTPAQGTPMTVHAGGGRLVCHHCGHRQARPQACPDCASLALQPQGVGTERLEELLAERFADWPVLRIDRSTTARRDGLAKLLAELGDRPGILVGTQILAKGHDLPNLTRVVVVGVDEGLFSSDFRAGEKLAQLLIQVAGRAGRARRAGEVWWQTHHPDHRLLHDLINGGYDAFARDELAQREAAGFPPFAHLALLRAEAQQADAAGAFLHAAKAILQETAGPGGPAPAVELLGPLTAPMARRAGLYRMQLLLSSAFRPALHSRLDAALPAIHALPQARRTRWSLDVDPVDLF